MMQTNLQANYRQEPALKKKRRVWIDHVTLARESLPEMRDALLRAGIKTDYGGIHSNGITHMAMAGFGDGSYLEVVAPLVPQSPIPIWDDYLLPDQGATAWTAAADDIESEFRHARAIGVRTSGPDLMRREKPNGEIGEWKIGYFGASQPGGMLPFLIQDRTARSVRVPPQAASEPSAFSGWRALVLAVHDRAAAADAFMRLYDWAPPRIMGEYTHFRGTPIYLASPAVHLARFGESPCAGVLGLLGGEAAASPYVTCGAGQLAGREVRWFDLPWPNFRLGLEVAR